MWIVYSMLGLVVLGLGYGYLSNYILCTKCFSLPKWEGTPDRPVVLLSDLHGCQFGKNNQRLVSKIQKIQPAFLLISGDMVVKNGKGVDSCIQLMKELVNLCPVYYGPGNHEIQLKEYESFVARLKKTGVIYLENQSVSWNSQLTISGLGLTREHYRKIWEKGGLTLSEMKERLPRVNPNTTQLLIAHSPDYFPIYQQWKADLVVSGHLHGGIMTLPFGGVIAPSLRLFPKYTHGTYQIKDSFLVLSKGLGLHHIKVRFFNYPEIVVMEFNQK